MIAGGTTDTGDPRAGSRDEPPSRVARHARPPRARQFPGVTAGELKDSVAIEAAGESDVVTVTAERPSPRQAAAVSHGFAAAIAAFRRATARAHIQRAMDAFEATLPADQAGADTEPAREVRAQLSQLEALKALQTGNVRVVEAATPPDHRSSPQPLRTCSSWPFRRRPARPLR
jgi:uncharacterized protein involved in exopolysaccharide biosynthesis